MATEETRIRLRQKLEETFGMEEASYLMDRPPGGWSDLVTNQILAAELAGLRAEVRADLAELRTELKDEIAGVRHELVVGLASVDERLRQQTWVSTGTLITGLGLVFAIARFV